MKKYLTQLMIFCIIPLLAYLMLSQTFIAHLLLTDIYSKITLALLLILTCVHENIRYTRMKISDQKTSLYYKTPKVLTHLIHKVKDRLITQKYWHIITTNSQLTEEYLMSIGYQKSQSVHSSCNLWYCMKDKSFAVINPIQKHHNEFVFISSKKTPAKINHCSIILTLQDIKDPSTLQHLKKHSYLKDIKHKLQLINLNQLHGFDNFNQVQNISSPIHLNPQCFKSMTQEKIRHVYQSVFHHLYHKELLNKKDLLPYPIQLAKTFHSLSNYVQVLPNVTSCELYSSFPIPLQKHRLWRPKILADYAFNISSAWCLALMSITVITYYQKHPITKPVTSIHISIDKLSTENKLALYDTIQSNTSDPNELKTILSKIWPQHSVTKLAKWYINPQNQLLITSGLQASFQEKPALVSEVRRYQEKYNNPQSLCNYWQTHQNILGPSPSQCTTIKPKRLSPHNPETNSNIPHLNTQLENVFIPSTLVSLEDWYYHFKDIISHPDNFKNKLRHSQVNAQHSPWQNYSKVILNQPQLPVEFVKITQFLETIMHEDFTTLVKVLQNPPKWISKTNNILLSHSKPFLEELLLDSVKDQLITKYNELVLAPFKNLQHHYPFDDNARKIISNKEFTKVLGANGSINQFHNMIKPLIDERGEDWVWSNFFNRPFDNNNQILTLLMHCQTLESLYFSASNHLPNIQFQISPHFIHNDSLLTFTHHKKTQKLSKGSPTIRLQWPEDFTSLKISMHIHGMTKPVDLDVDHPWKWFSVMNALEPTFTDGIAHINLNGEKFVVKSNKPINPLNLKWMKHLTWPKKIFS